MIAPRILALLPLTTLAISSSGLANSGVIDAFTLPAYEPVGVSGLIPLTTGLEYHVEVRGTFSYVQSGAWNTGPACGPAESSPQFPTTNDTGFVGFDAAWVFAGPDGSPECQAGVNLPRPGPHVLFDVGGGAGMQVAPLVNGSYSPSHVYTFSVVGAGHPLTAVVADGFFSDNYGAFAITVAAAGSSGPKWALDFDGVNDYARNVAVPGQSAHTYEAWVRLGDTETGTGTRPIVSQHQGVNTCSHGSSLDKHPGQRRLNYNVDPGGCGNSGSLLWTTDDCWVHCAATYDGSSEQKLYVNGVLVDSRNGSMPGVWNRLTLGTVRELTPGRSADVTIAEVRFWNYARTESQIQANLELGAITGPEQGLLCLYLLNEGSGQTVLDHSGNGYHLTLGPSTAADSADPLWVQANMSEVCGPIGTSLCHGDGASAPCPCGNTNDGSVQDGESGCANSASAGGAALTALGTQNIGNDDFVLAAAGLDPNRPGLFFQGALAIPGGGNPLGDGLLCVGGAVVRLSVQFSDAAGNADTSGLSLNSLGSISAGDSRVYQYWYRDASSSPCGSGFNLTNAFEMVWIP